MLTFCLLKSNNSHSVIMSKHKLVTTDRVTLTATSPQSESQPKSMTSLTRLRGRTNDLHSEQTEDGLPKKKSKDEHRDSENLNAKETDSTFSEELTDATAVPKWRTISGESLNLTMCTLYDRQEADKLLRQCEETLQYNTGKQAEIHVYGKWHNIPRKQVAHGDSGLTYSFSGTTVAARPWTPLLEEIRARVTAVTGQAFNFVLINRYKDGTDYISEHRDDEKDLQAKSPIASLTLGQERDFVFRHADSRGARAKRAIAPVTLPLKHGCLLMMNYPTNVYWYHSLPKRKAAVGVRINMTFRQMVVKGK